jgi:hypothetical protein
MRFTQLDYLAGPQRLSWPLGNGPNEPLSFLPEFYPRRELANFMLFVYRPHNFLSVYDEFLADVRLQDRLKDKYNLPPLNYALLKNWESH